jgi:hypothetical protein
MKQIANIFFILTLTLFFTFSAKAQVVQNDVIINEFLPNAQSADGKEYVELLVTSSNPVDISGFRLSDVSTKAGAGGTTEGHLDFPIAPYLEGLVQGTRILIILQVPSGNPNIYPVEDQDPSDSVLVLFSNALAGGSLIASGVLDLSTNENIVLLDGPGSTSNVIDYVSTGTNSSQAEFPDAKWYKLTDSIATSSSGTVTYFSNDRSGGLNNDTSSMTVWKTNQPAADKTPGQKNKNQTFPWVTATSGDGSATIVNITSSETILLNSTVFRRNAGGQDVRIGVTGVASGILDTVVVEIPQEWTGFSGGNITLGGKFTGKTYVVSDNKIIIPDAGLDATQGTIDIFGFDTPNPDGAGLDGIYEWKVYTAASPNPINQISSSPKSNVIIPISNIRTGGVDGYGNSDANGLVPVMTNKIVALQGVVTVEDSILALPTGVAPTTSFFIQDGDYGLQVFRSNANSSQLFSRGSKIIALGNITAFNGNTEIVPGSVGFPNFFVDGTDIIPTPLTVSSTNEINESVEGRLVRINGVHFDSIGFGFFATSATAGVKFHVGGVYRTLYLHTADTLRSPGVQIIGEKIPPTADVIGAIYHRTDQDTGTVSKRNPYKVSPRDLFDITRYSSVSGTVYSDLNGNGIKNSGEPGLSGWVLTVDGDSATVTDANGNYTIDGLLPGTYSIGQLPEDGWVQTFPAENGNHSVVVTTGLIFSGYHFGNFKNGKILGLHYEDDNGNGTFDGSDLGKPGPDFFLHKDSLGNIVETTTTDEDGNYFFYNLGVGTYFVSIDNLSGRTITQPANNTNGIYYYQIEITTASPTITGKDFGYFRLGSISGLKFFDVKANGQRDICPICPSGFEPVIADWKIYIEQNSEILDSQSTNQNGEFQFSALGPGIYTIREENRNGWRQTAPSAPGTFSILLSSSGQNVTGLLFGNRLPRRGMKLRALRADSLWSNALNWTGDALPSADDSIEVNFGDTIYVDQLQSGADSLGQLFVGIGGNLIFPAPVTLKLRDSLTVNGNVKVNELAAPQLQLYGSFAGVGTFEPGSSTVSLKGNKTKSVGLTPSGKASSATFYNLEIDGENTSSSSNLIVENQLNLLSNFSVEGTNEIKIQNPLSSAVTGTGKLHRGTMERAIQAGDTNAYRFHSSYTSLKFSGTGTPPNAMRISWNPDSVQSLHNKYRVEKTGTVDTANNAIVVSNVSRFSRWAFGQVGHKDSTGGGSYDVTEETTNKGAVTSPATLSLEYIPNFSFSEDSVAVYRISAGIFVQKYSDTDGSASTTNDQTLKSWGLKVRDGNNTLIADSNQSSVLLSEVEEGTYTVSEVDSAQWSHIQTITNDTTINGSSTSQSVTAEVGKLSLVKFINYYQPDNTKYRTFLSSALGGKAAKLKYKKNVGYPLPVPANVRDAAVTKLTPIVLGKVQVLKDSVKKYGWIEFAEGKKMEKYFPGVGTKAYPFDTVRVTGKKPKLFVKAFKNPTAVKYENHLATELAAYRVNEAASKTTPRIMSEASLGDILYNDPNAAQFGLNGLPIKRIADSADVYLTYFRRISEVNRQAYFSALDSAFTRVNREFNSGTITVEDTLPANGGSIIPLKIPSYKMISEAVYFKSPLGKTAPDSPLQTIANTPEQFVLYQNYPNPFNPATTIAFALPNDAFVTLNVYNVLGQKISTLLNNEFLEEGTNEIYFDATQYSSGVYFYRMIVNDADGHSFSRIRKMILMK